ncbi:ABC transporter ATP-binding protein [Nodosilinea sp. PGN35]|uniref:ABC transporter ATP-binding protein n=1 Tax=Nodosilinea sp. PGN35 TaxID=3020489 RepID=UPI0023B2A388|nr:ABC transporter ATP-binding protein [Nodosilinea sp. TSF1-S3]MDF0366290.1 ABC transporter ATP-binding protein [Nodosilinea sp. TSF1-S3]
MLHIKNVHKQFANGFLALEGIDLTIQPGEIVSLVGTSGCGKSTLLRILAGLDFPTLGEVSIDGEPIAGPHPKVGLIFQEARLMPWLTVADNIKFGLHGLPPLERQWRTQQVLQKVHLSKFAESLPRQLSGGMAQRVAIARALVTQPNILLLDEPFSALDAFTRAQLQDHLLEIWEGDYPTLVVVTHDVEEALVLSDRVIVLRPHPGRIHRELRVDLPRPRRRSSPEFQRLKEQLIGELDLTPELDLVEL